VRPKITGLTAVLVLCLFTVPLAAEAQESKAGRVPTVGVLAPGRPPNVAIDAFRSGLRDLGYVEDQNIVLEWRWDEDKPDRYAAMTRDLLQLNVDLIVAGTTVASIAARNATNTTPIVMAATGSGDPVELGLIRSFARPGGNVTGLVLRTNELAGKRLELLKETVPALARVALLWNRNPLSPTLVKEHEAAARGLGLQLTPLEVRGPGDFEAAFRAASRGRAQGLIMIQGPLYFVHAAQIAMLALKSGVPTISGETIYAHAGGLMNYGPNIPDSWRRAATYVDKILKGAKPSDLPVEQPTKFELAINLKTAKALRLTIPPSLLLRADQIVE
jgi:putative tryptophan/tyrosine transport system substrate-binding protein